MNFLQSQLLQPDWIISWFEIYYRGWFKSWSHRTFIETRDPQHDIKTIRYFAGLVLASLGIPSAEGAISNGFTADVKLFCIVSEQL